MARLQPILLCGLLSLMSTTLGAASSAEISAYREATNSFGIGYWDRSERKLAEFVEKFPKSERRAEAILMQAEARYQQTNSDGVITLLATNLDRAEKFADEYRFWIAEAQFQKGDFAAAATAYAALLNLHAVSGRRLESLVGEATARSRLGQWPQVVGLLGVPDGELARALAGSPTNEFVAHGFILLAEAHLAQKNYSGVELALKPLVGKKFAATLDWRAEYLRGVAQRAGGKLDAALATSSNLVALAGGVTSGRARTLAESIAMQAGIREQLGQTNESVAALRQNLVVDAPAEQQRAAMLKITELLLAQGKTLEAVTMLEQFLNQSTNAPAADVAWLTLGELQLRQHVAAATDTVAAPTNRLALALAAFDRLIREFPNSAFVGKAELDRGWCFWVTNQMAESAAAFGRAVARLPDSEDQSLARFKLGDALFAQNDFAGARENYRLALAAFPRWPRLEAALRGQALYQISRACEKLNDRAGAEEALRQILALPTDRPLAERSVLLVGQNDLDIGDPTNARKVFETLVELLPNSSLRPEVELLIARAREQQGDWAGAVTNYEHWLERFATNALRPQAEFQLALASFQAGNETNALLVLTNFVARFPTNTLAAQAQWWMADYYFRQGDFLGAEKNYKKLFQDWPGSSLAYEARMMAGRAAIGGQRYPGAIEHFTNLTSDLKCPPGLKAKAFAAYGDTLMSLPPSETNRLANYEEAIRVFNKLQQEYPTNELALLAWIEIAKCYWQMGSSGASNAVYAFSRVINTNSIAPVAARSEAEVGLAMVLEDQAQNLPAAEQAVLLRSARDHYLNVVFEENLRPGEKRDDRWVKEAGLKAGRVTEAVGEWAPAVKLYERMQVLLPALRATWQVKRDAAQKHLSAEKP